MDVTIIKTDGETDDYPNAREVAVVDPEVIITDEDGDIETYRLAEIAELYATRP